MTFQMTSKRIGLLALLFALMLPMVACNFSLTRNGDGTLNFTAGFTEAETQAEIDRALQDDLANVTADFQAGRIVVTGQREHPDGSGTDTLAFNVEVGVADGHLTVVIGDVTLNGAPILVEEVAEWNAEIAAGLEQAAQEHPNATLETATVTDTALTLTWRIVTDEA